MYPCTPPIRHPNRNRSGFLVVAVGLVLCLSLPMAIGRAKSYLPIAIGKPRPQNKPAATTINPDKYTRDFLYIYTLI